MRLGTQLRRFRQGSSTLEIIIVALLAAILLAMSVPTFVDARTRGRLKIALANLGEIEEAKIRYAKDKHLGPTAVVRDSRDLVPKYLPEWPSGPIPGATYAANCVDMEPTLNGFTGSQLQHQCLTSKENCIF